MNEERPDRPLDSRKSLDTVNSAEDLLELQRTFATVIRRPLDAGDAMVEHPASEEIIVPGATLNPHERLELYARQYWWRLRQSFDEDFPLLARLLGDEYESLRNAYLEHCPSESFTLRNLGRRLPDFIRETSLLEEPLLTAAHDCARLEWAIVEAFDGAAVPPVDGDLVASDAFPRTRLVLQPYVQLLALSYPVNSLLAGSAGREVSTASNTIRPEDHGGPEQTDHVPRATLLARKTWLVVHRLEFQVFVKPVSQAEFSLLLPFKAECSLEEWSGEADMEGVEPDAIQRWFQEWVSLGWLGTNAEIRGVS